MRRQPRVPVARFELRPNTGPSRLLFPSCATAHLACGHTIDLGVSGLRPRRMACPSCPGSREVGRPPEDR